MDNIYKNAFNSGNEFAWPAEDIPSLVDKLPGLRLAVLGCDVWIVLPDGAFKELYWYDFQVDDKIETDSWDTYVLRSTSQFMRSFLEIRNDTRIREEQQALHGEVYYALSIVREDEYYDLLDFGKQLGDQ